RASNAELHAAEAAGVLVLHRSQLLAILMRGRRGIAVAGTHGKTATAAMIALVLQHAGLDPSFLVGGQVNARGTNAHDGAGEWLVAEADESDGSFLWLAPEIAVVTSIEADHLDHYKDENEVRDTFLAFMENVPPDGAIVACIEDPGVRALVARVRRRLVTYGLNEGDWTAERIASNGEQTLMVSRNGGEPLELHLPVPGAYNALNALAAVAVASEVGLAFSEIVAALERYAGVRRALGSAAGYHRKDRRRRRVGRRAASPRRVLAQARRHRAVHRRTCVTRRPRSDDRRRRRDDAVRRYPSEPRGARTLMSTAGDVAARILTERAHGRVERNGSIAPLTSYRLGGRADVMLDAAGLEDLEALAAAIKEAGVPVLVVGRGSNMLVSDRGFNGVALRLGAGFRWSNASGRTIEAGGAMPLPALATLAMHHELAGFEFAVAIPASLGGAVRMNAG